MDRTWLIHLFRRNSCLGNGGLIRLSPGNNRTNEGKKKVLPLEKDPFHLGSGPLSREFTKRGLSNVRAIRNHAIQYLDQLDISLAGINDYEPVAVPSVQCQSCFNNITVMPEGDYYWVKHGSTEGLDYNDEYLAYFIGSLQQLRPEWKFRASCRYCHEELTFTKPHNCA